LKEIPITGLVIKGTPCWPCWQCYSELTLSWKNNFRIGKFGPIVILYCQVTWQVQDFINIQLNA